MKRASDAIKLSVIGLLLLGGGFAGLGLRGAQTTPVTDGPADQGKVVSRQDGNARSGQEVFRHETFGNEGFWTDAARAPQGMTAARVTPMKALELGLSVNVDALDDATRKAVAADLKKDSTGRTSVLLFDPNRGAIAPHPFFVSDLGARAALVAFLRSLDTN